MEMKLFGENTIDYSEEFKVTENVTDAEITQEQLQIEKDFASLSIAMEAASKIEDLAEKDLSTEDRDVLALTNEILNTNLIMLGMSEVPVEDTESFITTEAENSDNNTGFIASIKKFLIKLWEDIKKFFMKIWNWIFKNATGKDNELESVKIEIDKILEKDVLTINDHLSILMNGKLNSDDTVDHVIKTKIINAIKKIDKTVDIVNMDVNVFSKELINIVVYGDKNKYVYDIFTKEKYKLKMEKLTEGRLKEFLCVPLFVNKNAAFMLPTAPGAPSAHVNHLAEIIDVLIKMITAVETEINKPTFDAAGGFAKLLDYLNKNIKSNYFQNSKFTNKNITNKFAKMLLDNKLNPNKAVLVGYRKCSITFLTTELDSSGNENKIVLKTFNVSENVKNIKIDTSKINLDNLANYTYQNMDDGYLKSISKVKKMVDRLLKQKDTILKLLDEDIVKNDKNRLNFVKSINTLITGVTKETGGILVNMEKEKTFYIENLPYSTLKVVKNK